MLQARSFFKIALAVSLSVRLVLAAGIPMTGDEAYYVFWGHHLDYGYYDQPPMVGWWLWLLLHVSHAKLWLRLPSVLLPGFVAWVLLQLLRPRGSARRSASPSPAAYWAASVFALAPIVNLLPAITTDIPLIFWVAVAVLLFDRAERKQEEARSGVVWLPFASAGAALGAAFLSKYFATLVPLVWVVHWVLTGRGAKRLAGIAVACGVALWGPLLHLVWNWNHCWANIVFNLFVRNDQERFLLWHVESYLAQQAYLLLPPLLLAALLPRLWKWDVSRAVRKRAVESLRSAPVLTWLIPTLVFFALAFRFGVGMHFVLAFFPYFFVWLGSFASERWLKRSAWAAGAWLVLHLPAVGALAWIPPESFAGRPFYRGLLQTLAFDQIAEKAHIHEKQLLRRTGAESVQWLADAYSQAALLGFHAQRDVWVFGVGSDFGRVTDFVADWRALDGQPVVLLWQYDQEPRWLDRYFKAVRAQQYHAGALSFWIVEAEGFRAARYLEEIAQPAFKKYYRPASAPRLPGRCALVEETL